MSDRATAEGTAAYAARHGDCAPGHFRALGDLTVASVGIGTYLGDHSDAGDDSYRVAIEAAVRGGSNLIDTAINYRFQRSERAIGQALVELFGEGAAKREEVIVATKGGYIPFDGGPPRDPSRWFHDTFVETQVATADDVVAACHCMTPAYLRHQLATSLRNLRLHTVDIYYIHNPETQLGEISRAEFLRRIRAAFEFLEEAGASGQLRWYGAATWNGFRQPPSVRDFMSLEELVAIARDVGGADHRFRVVQLPYNLAMPEAFARQNQQVGGDTVSCIEAARRLGVAVVASASMLQGKLSQRFPRELRDSFPGLDTDAQRALQFVRSTPGVAAGLTGMQQVAHVRENLAVARRSPLVADDFRNLFRTA